MVDDEHLRHSLREPELLDWIRQNGCGLRVLGCWVPQCAKMFDSCCSWSVSLHKFSPRFSPVMWSRFYGLFRNKTKQRPIPSDDVIMLSKFFHVEVCKKGITGVTCKTTRQLLCCVRWRPFQMVLHQDILAVWLEYQRPDTKKKTGENGAKESNILWGLINSLG